MWEKREGDQVGELQRGTPEPDLWTTIVSTYVPREQQEEDSPAPAVRTPRQFWAMGRLMVVVYGLLVRTGAPRSVSRRCQRRARVTLL
mgnify:CR=1 FL=1